MSRISFMNSRATKEPGISLPALIHVSNNIFYSALNLLLKKEKRVSVFFYFSRKIAGYLICLRWDLWSRFEVCDLSRWKHSPK